MGVVGVVGGEPQRGRSLGRDAAQAAGRHGHHEAECMCVCLADKCVKDEEGKIRCLFYLIGGTANIGQGTGKAACSVYGVEESDQSARNERERRGYRFGRQRERERESYRPGQSLPRLGNGLVRTTVEWPL